VAHPPGPIQVGDHLHQIRTFRGRRVASTSAVKEYEPERRMVNASDPTVFPWVRTAYACEPSDEGTRLTFSIDLRGKGMFMLLSPLIRRVLHKDVVTRFATLETYLTTQRCRPDAPIIKSA